MITGGLCAKRYGSVSCCAYRPPQRAAYCLQLRLASAVEGQTSGKDGFCFHGLLPTLHSSLQMSS